MTLKELKTEILENTLSDDFLVLLCEDSYFVADQYIDAICRNRCLSKEYSETVSGNRDSALSLVFDYDNVLTVVRAEEFNEAFEDYSDFKNTIVICKKIDKRIEDKVSEYTVKIPKLVDWQLEDYARIYCKGLNQEEISFLVKACNNNADKLDNETAKLSVLDQADQEDVLLKLKDSQDSGYVTFSPFDLCNAIVSRDIRALSACLYYRKYCDFDSVHLVSILLGQFKNMLYLGYNSGLTAEQLGISSGRAYYIKKSAATYPQMKIKEIIKILTDFDQQLKTGLMDLSKDRQADYLITKLVSAI